MIAVAGDGVPDDVVARARAVVERVLEGAVGEVRLELHRTRPEMEAAVRAVDPGQPADFAAYYHYQSRTIFAYMAPRPEPALFADRLPGLLLGALVHEAHHARDSFADPRYAALDARVREGRAELDTVRFLDGSELPGAAAWRFLIESRLWRLRRMGVSTSVPADPRGLAPAQRATWYALAFARARGPAPAARLPWVLYEGSAEPGPERRRFRLVAEPRRPALLVRTAPGPLAFDVVPLDVGAGQIDLLFGFRSRRNHAKVAFLRRGGVRAMWRDRRGWRKDPLHPAPPLRPDRAHRISLAANGAVSLNGEVVLFVQLPPGRVGVGVWDGAADLRVDRSAPRHDAGARAVGGSWAPPASLDLSKIAAH